MPRSRHPMERSGLEVAADHYCKIAYRAQDWFAFKSSWLWLTIAAALLAFWRGRDTLLEILRAGHNQLPLWGIFVFFLSYIAYLECYFRLKDVARDRALERINAFCGARFLTVHAARRALLSKLFGVRDSEFVDCASALEKLIRLKSIVGDSEGGIWTRGLYAIYDPNGKPRIIAFTALLVAVIVASTRSVQVDEYALFEVWNAVGSIPLGLIIVLLLYLWIAVMIGANTVAFLEWLARTLDRRGSSNYSLKRAMADLIRLSRLA